MGRVGVEAVGGVAALDADHGVVDGRLDKPQIEEVLDQLLGRVAQQGGHGYLVPVGDDRRIVGCR